MGASVTIDGVAVITAALKCIGVAAYGVCITFLYELWRKLELNHGDKLIFKLFPHYLV